MVPTVYNYNLYVVYVQSNQMPSDNPSWAPNQMGYSLSNVAHSIPRLPPTHVSNQWYSKWLIKTKVTTFKPLQQNKMRKNKEIRFNSFHYRIIHPHQYDA